MSRRDRMEANRKMALSHRADSHSPGSSDATAFRADRAVLATQEVLVRAGATSCFDLAVRRLEKPFPEDPVVLRAMPVCDGARGTGAVSYVAVNAGGATLESTAIVTLHQPDRVLSWVLTGHPKFKEYWRFEPEPAGTLVHVYLGCELTGATIFRLWQGVVGKRRMERQARRLLDMVKEAAEAGR